MDNQDDIVKGAKDILNNPDHPFMKEAVERWKIEQEERVKFKEKLEKDYIKTLTPEEIDEYYKRKYCRHDQVPFVKSFYSDELVQRGRCPDCDVNLVELD
jgi:hypothetical protein